ncbi:MAG: phosphorylase [Cyanobacteria bacterium P01_G01_bin.19]
MSESATNPPAKSFLQPGTLWSRTQQQTRIARESGTLKSIQTEHKLIEQDDICFIVRTKGNLTRKEQAKKEQDRQEQSTGKRCDPFLPYELDMFVGDISPTHICLLNKFNVVDNHILIVTRAFEEQTDLLNRQDFEALWFCLQEIDGLGFFNGGETAGASQRHKHLQLIPLPFMEDIVYLPIAEAISKINFIDSLGKIDSFAFNHQVAKLNIPLDLDPQDAASIMLQQYHMLLNRVGISLDYPSEKPPAYNFLATREWMLIVPRLQGSFEGIPINSLGFAGSLFVRDRHSLDLLKQITPLKLLAKVAFSNNQPKK